MKEDLTKDEDCRPVGILPTVSKIFERLMQKQINEYINQFLSLFLCVYRKGFSTQTALVWLIEKWEYQLHNYGFAGALLMDLSKTFDAINYDILIANLRMHMFLGKML